MQTRIHRFLGQNIKGTPAMRAPAVAHDLRVVRQHASVVTLQEFRWPWYWRKARELFSRVGRKSKRWASSPSFNHGLAHPVYGAQAQMWKVATWKRLDSMRRLLHEGAAKISEDRYIGAALLADRAHLGSGLQAWFGGTHCVVGGDQPGDSDRRKAILRHDLKVLDQFLGALRETGEAVIFQMDANIRPGGWAYPELRAILREHGARLVGSRNGVEYLFVIDGRRVEVVVEGQFVVPVSVLRTDHEGRGLTFRLRLKAA